MWQWKQWLNVQPPLYVENCRTEVCPFRIGDLNSLNKGIRRMMVLEYSKEHEDTLPKREVRIRVRSWTGAPRSTAEIVDSLLLALVFQLKLLVLQSHSTGNKHNRNGWIYLREIFSKAYVRTSSGGPQSLYFPAHYIHELRISYLRSYTLDIGALYCSRLFAGYLASWILIL